MIGYAVETNYEALSQAAAQQISAFIKKNPTGLYCFAGGDTPVRTLELLAIAHDQGEIDLSQASFIELDEWVGIDPADEGSCASYLRRNLFDRVSVKPENLHFFDPQAADLAEECVAADRFITEHGGLDLVLLGVGVNGHLGFNEPNCPFLAKSHLVPLTASTQTVGKKYFKDSSVAYQQGITLGVGQLMASDCCLIIASGPTKRVAVAQILKGKVTEECPATAIWQHQNAFLLVDQDAVK